MAARPYSLAGSSSVAAANRTGDAWCSLSRSTATASAAGCAGTTAGVTKSPVAASQPSHGARTRTPVSWSRAPERSSTVEPDRSACRQCFRVRSSLPQKNVKSTRSNVSCSMAWTNVTSSPTWSSRPRDCSSSSSTRLAAPIGDSDKASFSSRPTSVDDPAIAILYTDNLLLFALISEKLWPVPGRPVRLILVLLSRRHRNRHRNCHRLPPSPRPPVCRPRPDPGEHVDQRNREQHHLREPNHDIKHNCHQHQQLERVPA